MSRLHHPEIVVQRLKKSMMVMRTKQLGGRLEGGQLRERCRNFGLGLIWHQVGRKVTSLVNGSMGVISPPDGC